MQRRLQVVILLVYLCARVVTVTAEPYRVEGYAKDELPGTWPVRIELDLIGSDRSRLWATRKSTRSESESTDKWIMGSGLGLAQGQGNFPTRGKGQGHG